MEDITNFTVTGPTFVTNNMGTENCFSAQNPYTNLLVSFDSLEDELFDSFPDLVNIVPGCPLLSIKVRFESIQCVCGVCGELGDF